MQAYLIDPFTKTITEVEYSGDIQDIYRLIEAKPFDCARFNAEGDVVFVDDNGLLNVPFHFFQVEGYPQPLAGKGLVLGCNMDTGESAPPFVGLEWLQNNVRFITGMPSVDTER